MHRYISGALLTQRTRRIRFHTRGSSAYVSFLGASLCIWRIRTSKLLIFRLNWVLLRKSPIKHLSLPLPPTPPNSPQVNKGFITRVKRIFNYFIMHQSIPAVPIPPPPGNSGAFSQTFHPGGRALAFHPITPGHLTISLLSPYNICRFV